MVSGAVSLIAVYMDAFAIVCRKGEQDCCSGHHDRGYLTQHNAALFLPIDPGTCELAMELKKRVLQQFPVDLNQGGFPGLGEAMRH